MSKSTIIDEPYNASANNLLVGKNSYRGLRIHSLPGLHEHVSTLLEQWLPEGASILELASGTGAMCARLSDMGYQITATDYVTNNFKLHGEMPFHEIDLNTAFASTVDGQYDCVLGMEIIEHLENPRNFIRNALALCKPNGLLVITTPNIASPSSQALFCRYGTFQWFDDSDYKSQGHIRPISLWELNKIFFEVSLRSHYCNSYGDPYRVFSKWPKMRWVAKLISTISITPNSSHGEILVMAGKK